MSGSIPPEMVRPMVEIALVSLIAGVAGGISLGFGIYWLLEHVPPVRRWFVFRRHLRFWRRHKIDPLQQTLLGIESFYEVRPLGQPIFFPREVPIEKHPAFAELKKKYPGAWGSEGDRK